MKRRVPREFQAHECFDRATAASGVWNHERQWYTAQENSRPNRVNPRRYRRGCKNCEAVTGIEVYNAANVHEAVSLAEKMKAEGLYDWFRGQVQETWPPHSSSYRRWLSNRPLGPSGDAEPIRRRQEAFRAWARANAKQLGAVAENEDALFAIMQHYGVPTDYIDFTTEPSVAGFFACDTRTAPNPGTLSCIYCLNTRELNRYWSAAQRYLQTGMKLRTITLDVPNLWRLEAQHGVFLFANYNWDQDYPPDRIVFPYTGYPDEPKREAIYPKRRSPLEVLLEHFFESETRRIGMEQLEELIARLEGRGGLVQRFSRPHRDDLCDAAFVRDADVPIHSSWAAQHVDPWLIVPIEGFLRSATSPMSLAVSPHFSFQEIGEAVERQISDFLKADPKARARPVSFRLDSAPSYLGESLPELQSTLAHVYDGMRGLPFAEGDIAGACGHTAALFAWGFHLGGNREAMASDYFGQAMEVAFSDLDGGSSKGYAAREALLHSIREDIRDILTDDHQEAVKEISTLLWAVVSPRRLFNFEKFVRIFASQIVPTQVLQSHHVLFSPATLKSFGHP